MPRSIRSVFDWLRSLWVKPMKEEEMSGDIIVCGVGADEIIDDIGVSAPKGEAVRVPGDKAYRSKDVWRLLSQGRLLRLNVNPLLRARAAASPAQPQVVNEGLEVLQSEYNKATAEIARLRSELSQVRSEAIAVRSELTAARAEIERLKGVENHAAKLDDIITLLKERPTVVNNVAPSTAPQASVPELEDIPMYIPSQIKSEAAESRVAVKEESAPASALADASKALREKRKKQ